MEIKKGDWVKCIKSHIGSFTKREEFTEGEVYHFTGNSHVKGNTGGSFLGVEEWKSRHFVRLYTIQDIRDGKVAVKNDGTLGELKKVLKLSNPCDDFQLLGSCGIYVGAGKYWGGVGSTNLPAQSVKDFLVQLPKDEPKTPDLSDEAINKKEERLTKDAIDWLDRVNRTHRISFPKVGVHFQPQTAIRGRITASVFNDPKEWQPKVGEVIEADCDGCGTFKEVEFLAYHSKSEVYKYAVVTTNEKGLQNIESAVEIRQISQPHRIRKQEIADHLGIPVEQPEIVE